MSWKYKVRLGHFLMRMADRVDRVALFMEHRAQDLHFAGVRWTQAGYQDKYGLEKEDQNG